MSEREKIPAKGWQALQWLAVTAALVLPVLENFSDTKVSSSVSSGLVPVSIRPLSTVDKDPPTMSSQVLRIVNLDPFTSGKPREYVVETRQLRFEFRAASFRSPASKDDDWILDRVERSARGQPLEIIDLFGVVGGSSPRLSSFFEVEDGRNRFEIVFRHRRTSELRRVPVDILHLKRNS